MARHICWIHTTTATAVAVAVGVAEITASVLMDGW